MFISPRYLANIENKGQHPSLQIFFELIQRYHIQTDTLKEIYHGTEDIPKEHKIFALPQLSIREQMTAYKEVIDRFPSAADRARPEPGREER